MRPPVDVLSAWWVKCFIKFTAGTLATRDTIRPQIFVETPFVLKGSYELPFEKAKPTEQVPNPAYRGRPLWGKLHEKVMTALKAMTPMQG